MDVVKRAEAISLNFARQSKDKLEGKQKKFATSKLSLVAQADFVYLCGLATSKLTMPQDPYKKRELLKGLKEVVWKHVGN